ncbi:Phytocyanin domain [Arabidopsis thaliana x Arabidopsis arenosa]|uniref:Phytocyanin domain n=1 Tax=Arabidopsis thaliana x Arabidopsis arenosa TaxID=1240361 RepID=A0A8T1ZL22_9BRAS|nr:Phytocyanin domain [Arabidopsis thaliana x Arabidopsis arenosa]
MATTTKIFGFVLLVITTFMVFSVSCSSATVYKVGDSDGWTTKDETYNYFWVADKEFHVGDSLVFEYDPLFNDVTQVSGALEYEFCDYSSAIAVYNTGHDVVTLTEPGYMYFISSNRQQCASGQRLVVHVVHDPSRPIPPPPPSKVLPLGNIYKVGNSKGWSVPEETDFYYKWAEQSHFDIGDKLLFEYGNEDNDVYEISGDLEFMSCDRISPISVHKIGHDLVTLTKPGVHYFISSKAAHCEAGLKLRVMVGPLTKPVTVPNVPAKQMELTLMDQYNRWLGTFRPQPHH